jgi:hypothetical protein
MTAVYRLFELGMDLRPWMARYTFSVGMEVICDSASCVLSI